MSIVQVFSLYLLAFHVQAAVFSTHIQDNRDALVQFHSRHTVPRFTHHDQVQRAHPSIKQMQRPLNTEDHRSAFHDHNAEIWDNFWLAPYVVPAALGSPPQPCRLLIDLTWDTLFVPSANCTGACDDPDVMRLPFDSTRSSTYSAQGSAASFIYGTDRFTGEVATDSLRIAGLEVDNQDFVNVERADTLGFLDLYLGYEGVLGLAPRWDRSDSPDLPLTGLSPWYMMVNRSILDANLFALELPCGLFDIEHPNRFGELNFGGINQKYASSKFFRLPLSNYSDQVWAVEAQSITWENKTHPLHEEFTNLTLAGFDTTAWYLALPGNWSKSIYDSVKHECNPITCYVDCDLRQYMPNMTLGLGGERITLTPFEYTSELLGQDNVRLCTFDVVDTERFGFPVDAIVLGRAFMETFYIVFDLDNMEVKLTTKIEAQRDNTIHVV